MSLDTLFNPSSIALIGVSHDPKKVGYLVAKNLIDQGYQGKMYFINNKADENILDKKVYKSLSEITETIDLVVLAIPATPSLAALDEIHVKGIKNVVIFAAGFKETEGDANNETILLQKAKDYGISVLGPNCIGFINTNKNINTTFLKQISPKGSISFVSQSGALGSVLVDYLAAHKKLGFSYFISLGNKSVLNECDVLEFLRNDSATNVIGMYLEDIKDGKRFMKLLQEVSKEKPVVIMKSGSTEQGMKAAVSHTGGLVGDDQVYDTVFKQCGAIRAQTFTEFMMLLKLYSFKALPIADSVLVLSNAGGVGVLYADDTVKANLSLITISDETKKQLQDSFSSIKKISLHNPIDLLGDASAFEYQKAIEATSKEVDVGAISVLLTPQANTQIEQTAQVIIDLQKQHKQPIYPIFMGEQSVKKAHEMFEEAGIASFNTYDFLSVCLSKIRWAQKYKEINSATSSQMSLRLVEREIKDLIQKNNSKPYLSLQDSMQVLELASIPVSSMKYIASEEEVEKATIGMNFPVVVKIASDIITHKTEVGGVKTNVSSPDEIKTIVREFISSGKSKGIYVQETVHGMEVIVGAKRDPIFGVVVVVGLGGIYTELIKDVSYRVFPFDKNEVTTMISETKIKKLLAGFRGAKPINPEILSEVIMKVGMLMETFGEIKEIDINPLFLSPEKTIAVDCRIIL